MGGPATEAGAEGASTVAGKVFGDAEKAGQLFEKVKGAVGGETVPVTDEMSQAAMRASELAEGGGVGDAPAASPSGADGTDRLPFLSGVG